MAWTRIDDNFRTNLKMRKAGADGTLLYLYGLLHCNTNLTDGYIDQVYLPQLHADAFSRTPKLTLKKLIDCGLWIEVDGGYLVNDFLEYNFTKEEIEKRRQAKIEAGRKGGLSTTGSKQPSEDEADAQADAQASDEADAQAKSKPIPIAHIPSPTSSKLKKAAAGFNGKNLDLYSQFEDIKPVDERIITAIDSAVNIYSVGWVRDAIAEAVKKGDVHSFGYVNSILERWKREGRNGTKPARATSGTYEAWTGGAR